MYEVLSNGLSTPIALHISRARLHSPHPFMQVAECMQRLMALPQSSIQTEEDRVVIRDELSECIALLKRARGKLFLRGIV